MKVSFRNHLWIVILLTGVAVTGLYGFASESASTYLYYGAAFLSLLAVVAGLLLHRPEFRLPWYLLIAALATLISADLMWDHYETLFGREVSTPSYADPLYIAGFCMVIVAFLLWGWRINYGNDREDSIDAGIVSVAIAAIAWIFILEPHLGDTKLSLTGQLIDVTYPVLDLFLLTLLIRVLMRRGLRSYRALALFSIGTLVFAISDALWSWGDLTDTYSALEMIADSGWMLCYVFWGAAALDPTVLELEHKVRRPVRSSAYLSTGRATLLVGSALMVPVSLILQQARNLSLDSLVIVISATGLFTLVVSRMQLIVRSLESAMQRQTELQRGLEFAAFHDPLTGLANRALLHTSLEQMLDERGEESVSLLFLDLDNFKDINDRLGHAIGDRLLVQVADQLRRCIRPQDMISRIGGDEFVVLLRFESEPPLDVSIAISRRILEAFEQPTTIDGHQVQVGASIGVAWLGNEEASVDNILRAADHAMYDAKRAGKNRYSVAPVVADFGVSQDESSQVTPVSASPRLSSSGASSLRPSELPSGV